MVLLWRRRKELLVLVRWRRTSGWLVSGSSYDGGVGGAASAVVVAGVGGTAAPAAAESTGASPALDCAGQF